MANEDYLTTSSHTIDTNVTGVSNSTTGTYSGLTYNDIIIEKWYIGERAKERLKSDLFDTLDGGYDYKKVKIERADIVIDGVNRKGYHLIVRRDWYGWSGWTYAYNNSRPIEITC